MKVGIIGAGFTGLAAAYHLSKNGHKVTVFEMQDRPGGLAAGYKDKNWEWTLEHHYHHLFTSDYAIQDLAREIGHQINFSRPKTSTLTNGNILQLDSPLSLLVFSELPLFDRIRTGFVLAFLRFTPFWKPLERVTAKQFILKWMGSKSWEVLWEPLFTGKFHTYASQVPASWFWARIKKRSSSLGYPKAGFLALAESIADRISKHGGSLLYNTTISEITGSSEGVRITAEGKSHTFDKVICTLPTPLFLRITRGLPQSYIKSIKPLKGIGAVNLIIALKKPFLTNGSYWLNINDNNPFLAIVEHTNYQNRGRYGKEHILYIGNYLPPEHKYFKLSSKDLVKQFTPALKKINSDFSLNWVRKSWVFKAAFAQPIVPLNYSKHIPPLSTPITGLYLANIQQVYPWDRGTNYAVELGEKVAALLS